MRKRIWAGAGAFALIGGLGALGGCDIVAVTALNLVETTTFLVEGPNLFMTGEINSKSLDQFEAVFAAHPQITTLVACTVPGSLDDATMIPLTYRVRELGLDTYLTADSMVASGGADLFLGGVSRQIEKGAQMGVHAWSDGFRDATDFPESAAEHRENATLIRDMLGEDDFYWFTIQAAPAADIHWMTADEMARFGVLTGPVLPAGMGPACPENL